MTATPAPTEVGRVEASRTRLVLLSFLMLFVELALIRWTGSNVVYLSYFSNFVLLGSFLGIGLGFLRGERRPGPLAVRAGRPRRRSSRSCASSRSRSTAAAASSCTSASCAPRGRPASSCSRSIFIVVAAVMSCIGQGVARTFVKFPPLQAYKLDLIGSVAGIVGFSVLSFLRAPPLAWGAVAVVVMLGLEAPRVTLTGALQVGGALAILIVLGLETFSAGTSWSPYYKIYARPSQEVSGALLVDVNGLPHQAYFPAVGPKGYTNPVYNLTYDSIKGHKLDNVLVIGAGGGNDVAVALRTAARSTSTRSRSTRGCTTSASRATPTTRTPIPG